jgi:hypothetical protein
MEVRGSEVVEGSSAEVEGRKERDMEVADEAVAVAAEEAAEAGAASSHAKEVREAE